MGGTAQAEARSTLGDARSRSGSDLPTEIRPRRTGAVCWKACSTWRRVPASIRTSDDVTKLLQQMHSESAKAQTQNHAPKPIKKEESTAVIAPRLPQRPAAELFEEAKAKRSQIKQLTEQIQYGCKNASCQNSACCLSANSSLHSQLGISNAADKS